MNFLDFIDQEILKAGEWILIIIFGTLIIILFWIIGMLIDNKKKRAIEKA